MTASEIKYIKSLSQKKFRDEYGVFAVEGEKLVQEALKSGFEVEKVFRTHPSFSYQPLIQLTEA